MFFFGAFSGNLIYLILVLSYLAGFSAMVMRGPEIKSDSPENADKTSSFISYNNQVPEFSFVYSAVNTTVENQAELLKIEIPPPVISYSRSLHFPPLLSGKSHFPGSLYFSRPPPVFC